MSKTRSLNREGAAGPADKGKPVRLPLLGCAVKGQRRARASHERLSRIEGVGESSSSDAVGISSHRALPGPGEVRFDRTATSKRLQVAMGSASELEYELLLARLVNWDIWMKPRTGSFVKGPTR